MLVNMKEMLEIAKKEGYGVIATDAWNSTSLKAMVEIAEEKKAPIILSLAEVHLPYFSQKEMAELAKVYTKDTSVPIALHFDHGMTFDEIVKAIHAGFTSVMMDASSCEFEENVRRTKEIVKIAHAVNVSVEAEIGHVGGAEGGGDDGLGSLLTDPAEAVRFVEETGVDCLAVSVGTAHGLYTGIPKLDFERLEEIAKAVSVPLVLHGGSGSGDENLRKAVELGISKINVFSDMLKTIELNTEKAEGELFGLDREDIAKNSVKECIAHYLQVFKSEGVCQ
jgi:fructose-bisphosphate aldolase class II